MFNRVIAVLLFLLLANITNADAKVRGESKVINLPSKILAEQRELLIHLPNNYQLNTELDYPVLYLLDGQRNFNHVIGSLDLHNQDNDAQEMIIVAIKNTHRTRDFTPTYHESYNEWGISGGADNFLNFLEQELIPYINKNYRTNKFKVLSGHSLSGLFAVYAMQARPELFQAHFAFSPSLWWHDKVIFKEAEQFFANRATLNTYLYINMGNEGGMMLSAYQQYLALLKKYSPKGFRYTESLVEQESHNTTALAGHPKAFYALQATLNCPKEVIEQGLEAIEHFYTQQSQLYGYQITPSYRAVNHAGYIALENKAINKAIKLFTYNIKNYPHKADGYDSLADGLAANGQLNEALNMMNIAIEKSLIENVENNSFKHHRDNLLNRLKER
ncbi:alpha/beta hydrolase-fold protein [Thalassotalea sp. 1_MG-2023]|uniref:alpha/beta hydrolase n=1 Tax=Thalassotalea sp. 1_MG-2023 TaxID=3062680 RepID=UPI0026E43B03|nr:alpha/beta hydrolase-fold protein [Thalassotalea sp. 1_MG-2023]MDO6425739.1 alpha/beta hydrolase-fold protein [Thalassotalea sp. 1_MG-2023]